VENLKEKASKMAEEIGKKVEEKASNWSEIVKELIDDDCIVGDNTIIGDRITLKNCELRCW
jgi:NDP-sugar pyrophosphorylase family protein